MFFWFKMNTFLARMSQKHFASDYLAEEKKEKTFKFLTKNQGEKEKSFQIFDQKSWTNPTNKMQTFDFLMDIA